MKQPPLKHAVVIGKFYPFHSGHFFLIHSASTLAEKVTVVVLVDTKRETLFNFEDRKNFVVNGITKYSPFGPLENVSVTSVFHQLETNYGSDETWQGFVDLIWEGVGKSRFSEPVTDLVCSDSTYGERLAHMMGIGYVDLSDDRKLYPVSATMIRENPFTKWDFLNPDVRAFFCKRIVVLGSESTGTTTLTNDLWAYLKKQPNIWNQSRFIPEYARQYIQNKVKYSQTNPKFINIQKEEIEHFAHHQWLLEEHTIEQLGCPLLVCDTDAFASQIWHYRYFGTYSKFIESYIQQSPPRTLYVLTSMEGIPFEDDGTRDGDDGIREFMEHLFEKQLQNRRLPYIKVKGSRKKRLEQVVKYLKLEK